MNEDIKNEIEDLEARKQELEIQIEEKRKAKEIQDQKDEADRLEKERKEKEVQINKVNEIILINKDTITDKIIEIIENEIDDTRKSKLASILNQIKQIYE